MLCPTCNDSLALTDQRIGLVVCPVCLSRWTSDTLIDDVMVVVVSYIDDASFPADAVDTSIPCPGCGGATTVERHINPADPSEGFETIECPACLGLGRA